MNGMSGPPAESQIEPSEKIRSFVNGTEIKTPGDLVDLKVRMRRALRIIPYDQHDRGAGKEPAVDALRREDFRGRLYILEVCLYGPGHPVHGSLQRPRASDAICQG